MMPCMMYLPNLEEKKTMKAQRSISNHFLFIGFWWQQRKKLRSLYMHISPLMSCGTDLMCKSPAGERKYFYHCSPSFGISKANLD